MKTIILYISLLIFNVGFFKKGFAQFENTPIDQYIVHNIGDTLFGHLTLEKSHISVTYINTENNKIVRKFPYSDISTYKNKAGNIIYKKFPTSYKGRPLELLVKGKINLYYEEYKDTFSGGYSYIDMYYIEKEKKFKRISMALLTKKTIARYIADDKISAKRLKNKRLTASVKNLKLLLVDYNKRNAN